MIRPDHRTPWGASHRRAPAAPRTCPSGRARRAPLARRVRDERGLAVPVTVTLAALVVVTAVLAATLGRLLVDQRRAASAADLSALAAATAVQAGSDGCSAAADAARRNHAALAGCEVRDQHVRVVTEVSVPLLLGREAQVHGVAVAGPVPAS